MWCLGTLPTLLWLGPTPCDERINPMVEDGVTWEMRNAEIGRYNAAYAELATGLGVPYLDIFETLARDARFLAALAAGDGVHPTGDGFARMAELVGGWDAWTTLAS